MVVCEEGDQPFSCPLSSIVFLWPSSFLPQKLSDNSLGIPYAKNDLMTYDDERSDDNVDLDNKEWVEINSVVTQWTGFDVASSHFFYSFEAVLDNLHVVLEVRLLSQNIHCQVTV
jgi:hypothetical protein